MSKYYNIIFISVLSLIFFSCSEKSDETKTDKYLNESINKAKITEFTGFYFVGRHYGIPSIYWYDYQKNKSKVFWYDPKERVIDLLVSPNNQSAFFITKRKQRLKSSQPAIEKGKLYLLNFETKKAELITQLVDGIQIIPFWIDNNRFSLVINSIDLTVASYINKNMQVYNQFGKLLSDNTEVFDLTKDGYPVTKLPLQYNSPNELFTMVVKNDSILIKQNGTQKEIKTELKTKELLKVKWAEDNKHVLFLMEPDTTINKSKDSKNPLLAIFDLQEKQTTKIFNKANLQYFRLKGSFLLLDMGTGKNSFIELTRLDSLDNFTSIRIAGGCSLRNL
jgi:hypothetical protein